jgi:hypothetical protein
VLVGKWVAQLHSRPGEVSDVPGDQGQVVDEGGGSDLLVVRILRMGYAQPTPYLRGVRVKRQDAFAVFGQEFAKPALESLGLPGYGKFAETPVSNQVENALNKWILIASAVYARPSLAVFGCFGNLAGARLRVAQRCRGAAAIR